MFQLGEFLAIARPALWFVAAFILTRGRKPLVRLLWLLVGVPSLRAVAVRAGGVT